MRSAPSVSYPAGRSRFGALVLGLAWTAGLASLSGWWWLGPAAGWRHAAVAVLWLGCGALALWSHRRTPSGQLHWDGASWTCSAGPGCRPVSVEAVIDLQSVLLLRLGKPDRTGSTGWFWVGQDADPACWQALRRAVYFRAPEQAVPPAGPVTS
ncbi:hypothetical protein JI739_22510 [Ramlibacter sp. AW1]|uniref:Uncharacterized protein n=1 Tax=Ramlibacter aurantiacus TaxID=2801330 RepID=A0A937D5W3_9BURK|nr:hypothetical protein [Ramlibacter aurantiacus]MBL0423125.1 hypothetical protein [Ramlibacter aurantiacus]